MLQQHTEGETDIRFHGVEGVGSGHNEAQLLLYTPEDLSGLQVFESILHLRTCAYGPESRDPLG